MLNSEVATDRLLASVRSKDIVVAAPEQSKPAVNEYALQTSPVSKVSSNTIPASPDSWYSRVPFRVKPDHPSSRSPASLLPVPRRQPSMLRVSSHIDTRSDDS